MCECGCLLCGVYGCVCVVRVSVCLWVCVRASGVCGYVVCVWLCVVCGLCECAVCVSVWVFVSVGGCMVFVCV